MKKTKAKISHASGMSPVMQFGVAFIIVAALALVAYAARMY